MRPAGSVGYMSMGSQPKSPGTCEGTTREAAARLAAEVVEQKRDDKIIVFKRKRRKGYRKKQGHRQDFTEIRVEEVALV